MTLYTSYLKSDIGVLKIEGTEALITSVSFATLEEYERNSEEESDVTKKAAVYIYEYLNGKRRKFPIPLFPVGTAYQRKVWGLVSSIPYGETKTYKDIAKLMGNEKGARAIGTALAKNPLVIIVPCHRVICSDGTLSGYVGGIEAKQYLINMEKHWL